MAIHQSRSIGSIVAHAVLLCAVVVVSEANAATIRVPQNYKTIQQAIDAATTGDVVIVSPGTYVENISFKGKNIVLRSANPTDSATVAATIIDGNQKGSVVTFAGTETSRCVLSGFTIRHGGGTGRVYADAGGVQGHRTRARIERNVIAKNSAVIYGYGGYYYGGGGGALSGCNGTIRHNVITSNTAASWGGLFTSAEGQFGAIRFPAIPAVTAAGCISAMARSRTT